MWLHGSDRWARCPSALNRLSVKYMLVVLLCVLACISITQGLINASKYSQDFQWSPTSLLLQGVDPYEEFLLHPNDGRILLTQVPVYSHFTYLLLSPLAFFPFEKAKLIWAGLNVAFCILIFILLRENIRKRNLAILFLIFMCSTSTRNAIGNGQQSLLSLVFYAAAIRASGRDGGLPGAFLGGVGAFKYSFGVPMFFAFDRNRFLNAAAYLISSLAGVVFWSLYFGKPVVEASMLPISAVQQRVYWSGGSTHRSKIVRHSPRMVLLCSARNSRSHSRFSEANVTA